MGVVGLINDWTESLTIRIKRFKSFKTSSGTHCVCLTQYIIVEMDI